MKATVNHSQEKCSSWRLGPILLVGLAGLAQALGTHGSCELHADTQEIVNCDGYSYRPG